MRLRTGSYSTEGETDSGSSETYDLNKNDVWVKLVGFRWLNTKRQKTKRDVSYLNVSRFDRRETKAVGVLNFSWTQVDLNTITTIHLSGSAEYTK